MSRRRLSFRLSDDEAAVVGPTEWWEALADHFDAMDREYNDEAWRQAAEHVREWTGRTRRKAQ